MSARSKTPEEKLHRYIKRIQKIVGQKNKSPNLSPISKIKIQKSPVKIKTQNIDSYIKYQLTLKNISNFVQNYNRNLKSLFFSKIRGVQAKHTQTIYRFVAIQKEQICKPLVNKQFAIKFIIVALKNIVLNLYKFSFGQIKKKKILNEVQIKRSNRIIENKIKQKNELKSGQKQQKLQKNACKSIRSEQFQRNSQLKVQNLNSKKIDHEINNKRIENQIRKIRSCCILQNLIRVNLFKRKKQTLWILIQRKNKSFQDQVVFNLKEELKAFQQKVISMNQQIKKVKNQTIQDRQLMLCQTQMLKQNQITLNQNLKTLQTKHLLINQKRDSQNKYKKLIAAKLICISVTKLVLQKQKQIFSLFIINEQLYKQSFKSKTFNIITTLQKISNKSNLLKLQAIFKLVFLFSKNISQQRQQRNQKQIIKQVIIQKKQNKLQNKQFFVKLSNMNRTLSKMQNLNILVHQNYNDAFKKIKNIYLVKISLNKFMNLLNNKIKFIFKDIQFYVAQTQKQSQKNKQNIQVDCIKKCSQLFNKLQKKQLFLKIQFFSKLKHKSQTFFKPNIYNAVLSQELIKKQIQQFFGQRQKVKDKAVQNWQKTKETLIYQNLNKNQSNQKHKAASSINFSKNMKILS